MVPLLEPPLLLERGWDEAEDRESPGPVAGLGVGDGEGVRVGDVLLDVEEFPDWGLFFNSIFYKETQHRFSGTARRQILKQRSKKTAKTLLEWTSEAARPGWEWTSGWLISGRFGGEGNSGNGG